MTREEAIERLNIHKSTSVFVDSIAEAIDMAIEALHREEVVVRCKDCKWREHIGCALSIADDSDKPKDNDFCSYGERREATIPTFAESEEAYKAWTGEEMGKTGDVINEMNKEIIKDILKMMPTAYLLEALGVSTFEELTEQADRPHGEWKHTEEVTTMEGLHWHVWRCTNCNSSGNPDMKYCPHCGAKMGGDGE